MKNQTPPAETPLGRWWSLNDSPTRRQLAKLAGTSYAQVYQIATGRRNPTAALAVKLYIAAVKMGKPITIESICTGCTQCPHRKSATTS